MMADLVKGVAAALTAQGLTIDVRDGAEVPAQELQTPDPASGISIPRVTFIENGLTGNLADRFSAATRPAASHPTHLFNAFMTREQGVEMRVWGFDTTVDATGLTTATPLSHRAAVNRLLHDSVAADGEATGVFPALYHVLSMAKESWTPVRGFFKHDAPDITWGALYVFEFTLPIPVVASRVAIATPLPAVTPERIRS